MLEEYPKDSQATYEQLNELSQHLMIENKRLQQENERYKEAWNMAKPIIEHQSQTRLQMIESVLKAGN